MLTIDPIGGEAKVDKTMCILILTSTLIDIMKWQFGHLSPRCRSIFVHILLQLLLLRQPASSGSFPLYFICVTVFHRGFFLPLTFSYVFSAGRSQPNFVMKLNPATVTHLGCESDHYDIKDAIIVFIVSSSRNVLDFF